MFYTYDLVFPHVYNRLTGQYYASSYPYYVRQYPSIDPTFFNESALSMQHLLKEASLVLNRLAQSKQFAGQVMSAAQKSDSKGVERLIKSTGIKADVKVTFNPDGINMRLSSQVAGAECCKLTIALRWR